MTTESARFGLLSVADYNDDKKLKESKSETPKSQEEKRKNIKTLIEKIPTDKSSLFKYALDWSSVDNVRSRRHCGATRPDPPRPAPPYAIRGQLGLDLLH